VLRLTGGRTPWVPLGTTAHLLTFTFFLDCSLWDITQRQMMLVTDVSEQPLCSHYKVRTVKKCIILGLLILLDITQRKFQLVVDVSGQPIRSHYKGRTVQ
jgi:hypothetical protein